MSYGVRRTLGGVLAAALLLEVVGLYFAFARGVLWFAIMLFAASLPFLAMAASIIRRLMQGDVGARLAAQPWCGESACLLVSRPLATADDLLRDYIVYVDNKRSAGLGYGDGVELAVSPGTHIVHAVLGGSAPTIESEKDRRHLSARSAGSHGRRTVGSVDLRAQVNQSVDHDQATLDAVTMAVNGRAAFWVTRMTRCCREQVEPIALTVASCGSGRSLVDCFG